MGADQTRATLADDVALHPELDAPDGITAIGRTIIVKGDLSAAEHLIVEGRIEGHVSVPEHGVAVGQHGTVDAEIFARTITVRGTVTGNLTATERVEILATGRVDGRLVAPTIAIDEGAYFKGPVDPKKIDAAIAVGRHRLKQRTEHTAS